MTSEQFLERTIRELAGSEAAVESRHGAGGGCINQCEVLELSGKRRIFIKRNRSSFSGLFAGEAAGLKTLNQPGAPRVPEVYGFHDDGKTQIIILEHIDTGAKEAGFWERFGAELAALHRTSADEGFGFVRDNHIGATEQPNEWRSTWLEFFAEKRIRFQLDLARKKGRADAGMVSRGERFIQRIPEILFEPERSSLLHGDLWGGNYMVDAQGGPVLIDPAVYYGHREADLAMTELFGGFGSRFLAAYHEAWPLEPGYEERRDAYNLYHMLNHLNLFGHSYASSVNAILSRYS